jgi:chromate transporter
MESLPLPAASEESNGLAAVADQMPLACPSFAEATWFWLKIGFVSFGGPAGQIALLHEEVVVRRRWIREAQFLHALNFCVLLPGPEAQQLATYLGWLLHRTKGALVAGGLFVLPAAIILWGLSWLYGAGQDVVWLEGVFTGLKAAVVAIVAVAGLRLGRKALRSPLLWAVAVASFAAIFFANLPFPLMVLGGGLLGWWGGKRWPGALGKTAPQKDELPLELPALPTWGRSVRNLLVGLLCWWWPVLLLGLTLGWSGLYVQQGVFFSKTALVTFGGAYAVLPYVAQQAVGHFGWLSTPQMMDGLGLAETTPGPLIMVLQFVGFMAGWQHPVAGWSPLLSATVGAAVTTWVTFAPCFLFILLGAPYVERLRQYQGVKDALTAITAAVVGVMANLWVWFAWHALVPAGGLDWFLLGLAGAAFWLLQRRRWSVITVVLLAGLIGAVRALALH